MGPTEGLDDVEKILDPNGTRAPTLGCPARGQSLYRLRYPAVKDKAMPIAGHEGPQGCETSRLPYIL
jgi:hypothetical protein